MKIQPKKSAKIFLFLLFFLGQMAYTKPYVVEGVGYTEAAAVAAAVKNAVDQAVAEMVGDPKKLQDQNQALQKTILAQKKVYVKSQALVSSESEFGLVKAKVMVDVATGKLEEDLVAQKMLYEAKNKPRIMVVLDERTGGEKMTEQTATHKVLELLLNQGFKVVEPEQLEKVLEAEKARALNDADLANLGFRMGADLIIRGGVTAGKPTEKTIYGKKFFTVPVQLNAHIVKADNAEMVAAKTQRVKKNAREEFSAAQFALEEGGKDLGMLLIQDLLNYWKSEAYNQTSLELVVSGSSDEKSAFFQKELAKVDFIKSVTLRYMEKSAALFDVEAQGTVQDLRDLFSRDKSFGAVVTTVTSNRLGIKLGNDAPKEIKYEIEETGLEIEKFNIQEIFPSRVRYYEKHPLATVKFKSFSKSAINNVKVSVFIPAIMDLASEVTLPSLEGGMDKELNINLILNSKKLMKITQTQAMQGQVTLTYIQGGKNQKRQLTAPVQVLDRNAMDWMEPQTLATFVTYREPAIHNFSRQAIQQVQGEITNVELTNAMAIFQALNELGIRYVKDPASSPGTRVLDRVQYPHETLDTKTGDCDDTSVLFAALLTAAGIESAVVSYPDHVLVWLNTGIYAKNRFALGADKDKAIVHKGTLWIPVETTLISKGFLEAWEVAASEFKRAVSDGENIAIIELDEAWKKYAAATVDAPEKPWKIKKLNKALFSVQKKLEEEIVTSWKKAIEGIESKKTITAGDQNELGILYARAGNYSKSQNIFEKMLKSNETSEILNNLACAVILSGEENEARKIYEKALKKQKLPGVAINRALTFYLVAQDAEGIKKFTEALADAKELLPKDASLEQYLGFSLGEETGTKAAGAHEKSEKQTLNTRELKELIKKRVLAKTIKKDIGTEKDRVTNAMPYGGVRGADPEQVAKIVNLLYWYDID